MAGNESLNAAAKAKEDEFYTQLTDIEKELRHYTQYFKGKTIFCNCDDPEWSNFWKYFELNFEHLGLKKLVATHFETDKPSYKLEIIGDINQDGTINSTDIIKTPLKQNGDFRSPEAIELLKEADIVITNPPFSLFREYFAQLMEYNKKFIIIGSLNNVHYKEIFPYIQQNEVWIGYSSGSKTYRVPESYPKKKFLGDDGLYYTKMGNTLWFTNLDIEKRHEELILYKKYDPNEYPMYLNYDAIEVNKVAEIPCDYFGKMGVPDTFIHSYNPNQFEIIGLAEGELGKAIGMSSNLSEAQCKEFLDECKSFRKGNPIFRAEDGKLHKPFARMIIRRKENEN